MAQVFSLMGAGVKAAGQVQAGNEQASVDQYNAGADLTNATNINTSAELNAAQKDQEDRRRLGAAAAAFSASGVQMQGSPLQVMADLTRQGELSKQTILYNGQQNAQVYRQRASTETAEATQAKTAGQIGAGATLLTSIGSAIGSGPGAFAMPSF